jgi:hypothetical protein
MADLTTSSDEAKFQQFQKDCRQRYEQLRRNAFGVARAMEGWQRVKGKRGWVKICHASREEYRSGRFLLERLGAERHLDPELVATLWHLRQGLLDDTASVAEQMLADLTVLAYYHVLRVQGWIGDLALHVEHEFFGQESPTPKFPWEYGQAPGLAVEDQIRRLAEQLLPLLDRANRMVLRNLKAMQELRQGPTPAVAIGRAEQVNVSTKQANAFLPGDGNGHGAAARNRRPTGSSTNRHDQPGRPHTRRGGSRKRAKRADDDLLGAGTCQEVGEQQPEEDGERRTR